MYKPLNRFPKVHFLNDVLDVEKGFTETGYSFRVRSVSPIIINTSFQALKFDCAHSSAVRYLPLSFHHSRMRNSVDITGAGSGVGKEIAFNLKNNPDFDIRLIGGRREDLLRQVAKEVGAADVVPGDLFEPDSKAYRAAMESKADVMVHNAAINIDTLDSVAEQQRLRAGQTAFTRDLVDTLGKSEALSGRRLAVFVNSVTAWMARENSKAKSFPYTGMKLDQADILTEARERLANAGIDLSIVYPGAIRTEMMSHLPEDDKAVRMANMFGKRTMNAPGHPQGIVQKRILQPWEVGRSIATLINYYLVNRQELPAKLQQWLLVNQEDLPQSALTW